MTPQPAVKSYFFDGSHKDCAAVISDSWRDVNALGAQLTTRFAYKGANKYLKILVGFWGWSGRIAFTVTATCWMAIMIAIHNFAIAVVRIACSLTILALKTQDRLWHRLWKIRHSCPYYCRDSKPLYICPGCGVRHSDLSPSEYGVFRRICQCGISLPTRQAHGRAALETACSECGHLIVTIPSSAAHIAFIGGPLSGKTNLFFAAQMELLNGFKKAGYSELVYADGTQKQFVESRISNLSTGTVVPKTTEVAPKAVHVLLHKVGRPVPNSLYFYDVAGEALRTDRDASSHAFYDHVDGIVFVIDPLSIEKFSDLHSAAIRSQRLDACDLPPQDAYPRMVASLSAYCSQGASGFKNARVAVVIAKDDLFGVAEEVEKMAAALPDLKNADRRSQAVREWLIHYDEEHLVRLLESDFRQVKYFSVSALGRVPDRANRSCFTGARVLDPITWSMGHRLDWNN